MEKEKIDGFDDLISVQNNTYCSFAIINILKATHLSNLLKN